MLNKKLNSRLQYISQGTTGAEHISNIGLALEGGCKWIQLRAKNMQPAELSALAQKVKQLCETYKAIFIVNDWISVAKETDADGVHLGLQDEAVGKARMTLGKGKIIGGSANTVEDCLKRAKEGCDYIGLGPFRYTLTKQKISPVLGIEGFKKIMTQLKLNDISIPVFAIGGIGKEDIDDLMDTVIYGIAVSGEITRSGNKRVLIDIMNSKLNKAHADHL